MGRIPECVVWAQPGRVLELVQRESVVTDVVGSLPVVVTTTDSGRLGCTSDGSVVNGSTSRREMVTWSPTAPGGHG